MHLLKPDIAYWVAATRLSGVGPLTLRRWLDLFGDIKILFSISAVELKKAGLSEKQLHALKNVDWRNVESDLRWSEKNRCEIISLVDPRYPRLLREIPDAPSLLYVRGDVNLLSQSQLAIVGSRNPTAVGNQMAEDFAYSLTKAGLVVTSGLALGIDAASHRGALRATGKTIAVFGTGLKHIYPRSHRSLAEDIAEQGALVSEFPPDESPKAKNFPRRNRIISGLSIGVLVVEAVLRSGSLITARYAVEQGRDVFAIPGSIHNPLARGCHALIRQGAKLVETAEDIVEELDALHTLLKQKNDFLPAPSVTMFDEKTQHFIEKIGYDVTPLDAILLQSGLTTGQVSSMLLSLELQGHVQAVSGGYVRVANKR